MWLEIIITLLLGGILYILVRQWNSKPTKSFKVTDGKRKRTVLLKYTSSESFSDKCRATFNLGNIEKLHFVSAEDEDVELDTECLEDLENKSLLIIKGGTTGPKDDNDDFSGFDIRSGGLKHNTVVDNADIKKWEDIQAGNEVKEHIIQYGLKNITNVLKKNMDAWKSKPLNIAVTGESGKGKSSFINAFRGMYPGQDGAAEVDEKQCTRDCRAFRHPQYDSFVLWDVPGVGTKAFPKETYLNDINVDKYDFFMVIITERLMALDSWIAKEIVRRKKKFYFIRTKIDVDMANRENRFRRQQLDEKLDMDKEFNSFKDTIYKELKDDVKLDNLKFFMISNNHPNKYDFPLILNELLHDVPDGKKDAMVFALQGMSKDIIVEKASALKSRIWKVALMSGAGAGIPIPFISTGIDTALILEEVLFYREQFGLDDQSLKHLADMAGISLKHLKFSVKFKTPVDLFTSAGLSKYLVKYGLMEVVENVVKYTVPIYGVGMSCGISFSTTMAVLEEILEFTKQDALNILLFASTGKTETEIN